MTRSFAPNPGFRAASLLLRAQGRLAGAPVEIDGQRLDPHLQLMLKGYDLVMRQPADVHGRRADNARGARLAMPLARGVASQDSLIEGPGGDLPIRLYRADGLTGRPPIILYFHGGGFAVGSIDTHEPLARMLARITRCIVISVGYRLAPEDPYPAAVQDGIAAYDWASAHGAQVGARPGRVAVAGDSAGGNLAAVVSLAVRDRGTSPGPIAQILLYPVTDLRMGDPSHRMFAEGFFLTEQDMQWYRAQYAPAPQQWLDPYVSPVVADRHDDLPPTRIWTAGFDPLRDEAERYGKLLADAGGEVETVREPSLIHGYFSMGLVPGGLQRTADMCRDAGALVWSRAGL